ncbi:MAG: AMP-binding protein [Parachlamydiaceae bacterium]|nr:AMP-binding protein [Parachlamydiaceae bacterium]
MKTIFRFLMAFFMRIVLWFRYRIEVKGLELLNKETLNKPGGVLFLPTHPTVFVDATSISIALWNKYPLRPLIVEYMYQLPIVNWVMKFLDALPIPSFTESSNSLKRKQAEKVLNEVMAGLRNKENFLIFPAGHVKSSAYEAIDGASAVHRIVQETPEANVVLVRVKGLWGSSFSRALIGKSPPLFATMLEGAKYVFKNLLFFTPRRRVIIEFMPAPADFPYHAGRIEFNRYLEAWYNQPDGLLSQKGTSPGDSLVLVSYSLWSDVFPEVWQPGSAGDDSLKLSEIPADVQRKVKAKITELLNISPETIQPQMSLTTDLGMDSLDVAEMLAFLQDQYDISHLSPNDLTSVLKVMALASGAAKTEGSTEEDFTDISAWLQPVAKKRIQLAEGDTIPEVFLNNCSRMGKGIACSDMRAGIVTYSQMKLRTIILAEYIRTLPGKYVGILLPASVAATTTILACQLAGKVPLMVNWTVGSRHLKAVADLSKVQVVLSSWAFIDRLKNVDFTGMEEMLVMLEDVRSKITLKDKVKAFILSRLPTKSILKALKADKINKNDEAVLLFTSGTENLPKGVPLSHNNILSNQRAMLEGMALYSDDIVLGILPPFHSFGFTISGLTGLLSGAKVAYSPDPTDAKRLAQAFAHWHATIICGAPSFVKGMIKAAFREQLATMRLCITGAEKMPPDLIHALEHLGKADCLYEGYGITECSPVLTFNPIGKPRIGVGRPLSNVELLIVDLNTHAPLGVGQQGLILARGPNIFQGYLPGPASPFVTVNNQEWYVTGDLGSLDEQGNLTISGRLKRFLKVGGEMVSLASIEEALSQAALKHGWANSDEGPILAVSGKEIPGEKPKITLFCRFAMNVDDVNKTLRESGFSNLVKVTSVVEMKEIPLMGSGKVNYRLLDK